MDGKQYDGTDVVRLKSNECAGKFVVRAGVDHAHISPKGSNSLFRLAQYQGQAGIVRIAHDPDPTDIRHELGQQLNNLAAEITRKVRKTCDVAARSCETFNQTQAQRITYRNHDNGYGGCRASCRKDRRRGPGQNDVNLAHKFIDSCRTLLK